MTLNIIDPRKPGFRFATAFEEFLARHGALKLGIVGASGGFVLCLLSFVVDVASLKDAAGDGAKEVGFLSSVNWTGTFLILFPLYLVLVALQQQQCGRILNLFPGGNVITGPDGATVTSLQLRSAWQRHNNGNASFVLWLLLALVVLQTLFQWWNACATPIWAWHVTDEPRDWTTATILMGKERTSWRVWSLLSFTFAAYAYMAAALFAYLGALTYSLSFAHFLFTVSVRSGEHRLLLPRADLGHELTRFYENLFYAAFLGLCAAMLMSLQVSYLRAPHLSVASFLFRDIGTFAACVKDGVEALPSCLMTAIASFDEVADKNVTRLTSYALAAFTLICLAGATAMIYLTIANARAYFLSKVDDPTWLAKVHLARPAAKELDAIRQMSFATTIAPQWRNLLLALLVVLLCTAFTAVGTVVVAMALYAVMFLLVRKVWPK